MLYEKIMTARRMLENEVIALKSRISKLPEGKLICTRNDKRYKWYQSDGKTHIYIPKSNRALAEQLAMKKYLTYRLEEAVREKRALDFYLRHHDLTESKSREMLAKPEYQEILKASVFAKTTDADVWMKVLIVPRLLLRFNYTHPMGFSHRSISLQYTKQKIVL